MRVCPPRVKARICKKTGRRRDRREHKQNTAGLPQSSPTAISGVCLEAGIRAYELARPQTAAFPCVWRTVAFWGLFAQSPLRGQRRNVQAVEDRWPEDRLPV